MNNFPFAVGDLVHSKGVQLFTSPEEYEAKFEAKLIPKGEVLTIVEIDMDNMLSMVTIKFLYKDSLVAGQAFLSSWLMNIVKVSV